MALAPDEIELPLTPQRDLIVRTLKQFKLTVTGSSLGLWRKLLIFLSFCDTQEHLALVELALQPIIQEFWNSVARQQLANAFGKRDKLALLESRLTMQAMDVAFTAWGIMKTMPRAQKMTQLVNYQRSITRPTTGFPLEVRDYLKLAVGQFNEQEFQFRGTALRISCNGVEEPFNSERVLELVNQNQIVQVANGIYRGTRFPTFPDVITFAQIVLGTSSQSDQLCALSLPKFSFLLIFRPSLGIL